MTAANRTAAKRRPASATSAPPITATTAAPAAAKAAAPAGVKKQRLASADRERQIIDGAITYFAEAGFSGQTRELSKRLGITQPLLYRYFASKQALIERVYQTVFEGRWNPAWIPLLRDRSTPLRDRLIAFYRQYSEATYRPDWIRIYMHAGLSDPTLNQRYIRLVRRELMPVYVRELRDACGIAGGDDAEIGEDEIEFVWSLHGGIFYMSMRQHVYQMRIHVDFMAHVALVVDNFIAGARSTYPKLLAARAQMPRQPHASPAATTTPVRRPSRPRSAGASTATPTD